MTELYYTSNKKEQINPVVLYKKQENKSHLLYVQTSTALWFCFSIYPQLLKVKSKQSDVLNYRNILSILITLVFTTELYFCIIFKQNTN